MVPADGAGSRIRRRRQELGLTQEELAARVGVSAATVMRWELGRNFPSRHQGRLEAALGIRLNGTLELPVSREELLALEHLIKRRRAS